MRLTPTGRTVLWIGIGAFVGLAVGGLVTNPDRARSLSAFWLVGLGVFVGVVISLLREKTVRAPRAAAAPATRAVSLAPGSPLHVTVEFPAIPDGYPLVIGEGETLAVSVRARRDGEPVQGAAIKLTAKRDGESLTSDGVTGSDGEVGFTLEPETAGEMDVHADAKAGTLEGGASVSVSVVRYEDEIERLFGEFRAFAHDALGPDSQADTARELCDKLRARSHPTTARALLELARAYEVVAYAERRADRALYLTVLEQLMVLEHAELSSASGAPVSRGV